MKLAPKEVTRRYELTYVVPAVFTDAELKSIKEEIDALLGKHKVEAVEVEDWGKKKLAYSLSYNQQAQHEAYFAHVMFTAKPEVIKEIERSLRLNEKVIRHLLVVSEVSE